MEIILRNSQRVASIAPLFLAFFLITSSAHSQIKSEVVLSQSDDSSQIWYSGLGCSDDHNCTVIAYALNLKEFFYYVYAERTTDGGNTWTRQSLPIPNTDSPNERYLNSVYCIDSSNILLLGDSGRIFRTFDAGKHWVDQTYNWPAAAGNPSFLNPSTGIIAEGGGLIIKTTDAGMTWNSIPGLPYVNFTSAKMFTADSFAVYQRSGPIFRISQDGATIDTTPWIFNPYYTDTGGYQVISQLQWLGNEDEIVGFGFHHFPNQSNSAANALLVRSTDGGMSWSKILDRNTKLWSPISFDAHGDGTAIMGGGQGSEWVVWSLNWRTGPWYEDTINLPIQFEEIPVVSLLDNRHALLLVDNGGILSTPFAGFIVRVTLNSQDRVEGNGHDVYHVDIYPNPASVEVNISTSVNSGSVLLFDVLGRRMISVSLLNGAAKLNVSTLPHGMYNVMIDHVGQMIPAGKIIVH
jgi:hypothetical protein